jgi:hypothetical protein
MTGLQLNKITAYRAYSSDGYTHNTIGYFRSSSAAEVQGKKEWGGSDMVEVYTDGQKLYEIKCIANCFADDDEAMLKEQMETIRRKLTHAELELLKQNVINENYTERIDGKKS